MANDVPTEYDTLTIDGLPLPGVIVLPPGATFKVIEASASRCECGAVHEQGCRVAANDGLEPTAERAVLEVSAEDTAWAKSKRENVPAEWQGAFARARGRGRLVRGG
jgi:hypothetical protein